MVSLGDGGTPGGIGATEGVDWFDAGRIEGFGMVGRGAGHEVGFGTATTQGLDFILW